MPGRICFSDHQQLCKSCDPDCVTVRFVFVSDVYIVLPFKLKTSSKFAACVGRLQAVVQTSFLNFFFSRVALSQTKHIRILQSQTKHVQSVTITIQNIHPLLSQQKTCTPVPITVQNMSLITETARPTEIVLGYTPNFGCCIASKTLVEQLRRCTAGRQVGGRMQSSVCSDPLSWYIGQNPFARTFEKNGLRERVRLRSPPPSIA